MAIKLDNLFPISKKLSTPVYTAPVDYSKASPVNTKIDYDYSDMTNYPVNKPTWDNDRFSWLTGIDPKSIKLDKNSDGTYDVDSDETEESDESDLAVGEGLIGAAAAGKQIGGLADTQQQQNMIDSMYGIGKTEFNSFDQLQNEWNRLDNLQPNLNWEDIRGGSFNERLGTTISSTLGNTIAGAKINPYLGAAMGAGTLAWNLGNWVAGDQAATNTQKNLNLAAGIGENVATTNLAARGESLADYNSRNAVSHVAAKGGKITTLKEFSDGITKRAKANDTTRAAGIVREYCKGGVRIRIKR